MKIGELEVPDSAVEAELKKLGKRLVEDSDYVKKSEAAADLAKFRKVTGETRSIEDIEKIIHEHEETQKKNKTQTELLMAETKRLQEALQAKDGEIKKAMLEVKVRDVKKYFDEAMIANKVKIIEPILEPYRQQFYEIDDASLTPEALKQKVNDALLHASEMQKGELLKLGLQGITPESTGPSFGGGFSSSTPVNVTPSRRVDASSDVELFEIMRQTSATPMGVPIGRPPQKP